MEWSRRDIITYYKNNELAYRIWGPNMHYGYWEKGITTQRQASLRFNDVMVATAGIKRGERVLDAGCGVGGASIYLAKTLGCRVTGITICPRQVEQARKNAAKEGVEHLTDFHEMDYEHTTFENGQFDVVWGLESVCYAESKAQLIKEAFRILKSDGRLVIADGFASKPSYEGKEHRLMHRWLDGWIVNFLNTPSQFGEFAEQAGFERSSYRDVTDKVYRTSQLMFLASMVSLPFHIIDHFVRLKSYPADAMFNQYLALRKGLWEYGIFLAEKKATQQPL